MDPFTTLAARGVALNQANIDTDQLIPARFMRKPRSAGYGNFLLHDLRFDARGRQRADFPLNKAQSAGAEILVAGRNFGSGSSREAAVYALVDFGFRCVVAPSFGDIFTSNAVKNGLLPAQVSSDDAAALIDMIANDPGVEIAVDLPGQEIIADGRRVGFDILPNHKEQLIAGRDDIDMTLAEADAIAAFVERDRAARPWAQPRRA